MAPFNDTISAADAAALIPNEVSTEVIKNLTGTNPLLRMATKLPNLSRSARTMPVLATLPTAYFVNGATGLKQTTDVSWANVNIHAEELAVIVPIPQSVLDDSDYPIWAEVQPLLVEAFGIAINQAVLYGTNIPANWTVDLGGAGIAMPAAGGGCAPAGHVISAAAYADLYEAVFGETAAGVDGAFMVVEADGFGVTGAVAHISMRGLLRNTRDTQGLPIFATDGSIGGVPFEFPTDGSITAATSLLVAGDWKKLVYALRQDITYTIAKEAIIQDGAGNIVYNLFQQDMVALRAVMRLGFALPNPPNRINPTAATRYPFCIMTP